VEWTPGRHNDLLDAGCACTDNMQRDAEVAAAAADAGNAESTERHTDAKPHADAMLAPYKLSSQSTEAPALHRTSWK